MSKVFISYRRADSEDVAGRIYDRLVTRFGAENAFKDFGTFSAISACCETQR
jgi:hypothetical protein